MNAWVLERNKYMNESEVKKLRKYLEDRALADLAKGRTRNVRVWAVIDFALGTGARVAEICNVKIEDLDLQKKEPKILIHGKGKKQRWVYISQHLRKHLLEYLDWKKKSVDEPTGPDDYLFISERGDKFATRSLQSMFKSAVKGANLPTYSIHACRHSFGTYLYQNTKNLRMVQKQLGHSSVATTQVYADVTPEEMSSGMQNLWE
jgi:site-specific recombinase XerD